MSHWNNHKRAVKLFTPRPRSYAKDFSIVCILYTCECTANAHQRKRIISKRKTTPTTMNGEAKQKQSSNSSSNTAIATQRDSYETASNGSHSYEKSSGKLCMLWLYCWKPQSLNEHCVDHTTLNHTQNTFWWMYSITPYSMLTENCFFFCSECEVAKSQNW